MSTPGDRAAAHFQSQATRTRARFGGSGGAGAVPITGSLEHLTRGNRSVARAIRNQQRTAQDFWIRTDDGVQRAAAHWLGLAAPALLKAFEDHLVPLAETVRGYAPRKSGALADGVVLSIERRGKEKARLSLRSGAWYSFFVKYPKRRNQPTAIALRVHGRLAQLTGGGTPSRADLDRVGSEFRLGQAGHNRADRAEFYWRWVENQLPPLVTGPHGESLDGRAWWATLAVKPFNAVVRSMTKTAQHVLDQGG